MEQEGIDYVKKVISIGNRKYNDLSGQKFNHFEVLTPIENKRGSDGSLIWTARCSCGSIGEYASSDLKRGNVKSCGCVKGHRAKGDRNFDGQRFGKLIVIRTAGKEEKQSRNQKSSSCYICDCDCGTKGKIFTASHLLKGDATSCGCSRKVPVNRNPDRKEAMIIMMHKKNCSDNASLGASNHLTYEDFKRLILSPCSVCGMNHSNTCQDIDGGKLISSTVLKYNGLDQIIPRGGYVIDNVRTMCLPCNIAKGNLHDAEYEIQVKNMFFGLGLDKKVVPDSYVYRGRFPSKIKKKSQSFISEGEINHFVDKIKCYRELGVYEPSI